MRASSLLSLILGLSVPWFTGCEGDDNAAIDSPDQHLIPDAQTWSYWHDEQLSCAFDLACTKYADLNGSCFNSPYNTPRLSRWFEDSQQALKQRYELASCLSHVRSCEDLARCHRPGPPCDRDYCDGETLVKCARDGSARVDCTEQQLSCVETGEGDFKRARCQPQDEAGVQDERDGLYCAGDIMIAEAYERSADCAAFGKVCVPEVGICADQPQGAPPRPCQPSCSEDGRYITRCLADVPNTYDCTMFSPYHRCDQATQGCVVPKDAPIYCEEDSISCEGSTLVVCKDHQRSRIPCGAHGMRCVSRKEVLVAPSGDEGEALPSYVTGCFWDDGPKQ